MNPNQIKLIQATIPILRENGVALTKYFYERMFKHNPELKNLFNQGNQANGKQQTILAYAVLAYAENIENPGVLIDALKMIGQKHTSLTIQPEQYDIVGNHLINSIKEVLGDAATDELLEAWTLAYTNLAQIMIQIEQDIYLKTNSKPGGWNGWREFVISDIKKENEEVSSFYFSPKDGLPISEFTPGQYISVKLWIESLGHEQPRQYSLSESFNPNYYRISVKKEIGLKNNPDGIFSNELHTKKIGDSILLTAPAGDFTLNKNHNGAYFFISGGIGVTPLYAMLESLSDSNNEIHWIQASRNKNIETFTESINQIKENNNLINTYKFYETIDTLNQNEFKGFVDLKQIETEIQKDNSLFYICGPENFIKHVTSQLNNFGIDNKNVFFEEFGPQLLKLQ